MKWQQLVRIDKVESDPIFLLSKNSTPQKYIFDICGTSKNIYKVQIYKTSKMIYCNCPDARGHCKRTGVICKHSCFILLKVLKIPFADEYFNKLIFTDEQLEFIKEKVDSIIFEENNFINMDYISKYNAIKNKKDSDTIQVNENIEMFCPICYDEFSDPKDKKENYQCLCCQKIFHNKCLNKWKSLGNTNCPYCRTDIKNSSYYTKLN